MNAQKEIAEIGEMELDGFLEHIITEDMAIVGKESQDISSIQSDFEAQLKNVINTNLISFLNVAANVKIINRNYQGENFWKRLYARKWFTICDPAKVQIISGIEKHF